MQVRVDADTLPARIRFIDNAIDATTGTLLVKAQLDNADGRLTAGQFVQEGLPLDTLRAAATVPAQAIQQGADGSFVFVAHQGKVTRKGVTLAVVQDNVAVIAEGLTAGDQVVTEGHLRLFDGAVYRDVAAAPAAPANPGAAAKTPAH